MLTAPETGTAAAPVASWTRSPVLLRRLALASVVANVAIVVTGGGVRLTGSGLGCPTFPRCTEDSFVPTGPIDNHEIIEFGNRQLTFVLGLIALATLVVAIRQRTQVRLAVVAFLGIPAQALLGGITVLTGLNPYTVAAHFLVSMGIVAITLLLWWRLSGQPLLTVPRGGLVLARVLVLVAAGVLALGTIVTGTGPHAGDEDTWRIALDPLTASQLHADAVMLLIGLSIGVLAVAYATGAPQAWRRAAWLLIGAELVQGLIGYVQYFTGVPPLLVAAHMLGATLVWIAALRVLYLVETSVRAAD